MKVISFDVGIKNMAYCILNVDENLPVKITEWKTVNLMNEEDSIKPIATTCSFNNKPKKGVITKCTRHALYMKTVNLNPNPEILYFCDKHAKERCDYFIPDKSQKTGSLNKLNTEQLIELCQKYSIILSTEDQTKRKKLVGILSSFFKEKCFEVVKNKKQKNSKETDLISICRNMRRELNKIQDFETITHIIIENQISTLAARMNSIQGMLVQYFIMRKGDEVINIDFISSSNKLKGLPTIEKECLLFLSKKEKRTMLNSENNSQIQINEISVKHNENYLVEEMEKEEPRNQTVNSKYKEHKKDGVYHCSMFLDNNTSLNEWKHVLVSKKKDDYADCFLQGVWYIKNNGFFKENTNYCLFYPSTILLTDLSVNNFVLCTVIYTFITTNGFKYFINSKIFRLYKIPKIVK